MMITLSVLLWAFAGQQEALSSFEDDVLGLLDDHGGVVLSRVRAQTAGDGPSEVHLIRFESSLGFESYMADPRRIAMTDRRSLIIERTTVQYVEVIV
jgi:hypothetical protein